MCCRSNNDPIKRLLFIAVLGIFVFASYSLPAYFAFMIHTEFGHDQKDSSLFLHHIKTGTAELPDSPLSSRSDEEELPAALRSLCGVFSSPGTFGLRIRNKTLLQLAVRFIISGDKSSPLSVILERSFYRSKNNFAKAFLSVKTTRKLE